MTQPGTSAADITRAERDHVASILWQTLQATGEDCSGWDGWQHWAGERPLATLAREVRDAVERLRAGYDDEERG